MIVLSFLFYSFYLFSSRASQCDLCSLPCELVDFNAVLKPFASIFEGTGRPKLAPTRRWNVQEAMEPCLVTSCLRQQLSSWMAEREGGNSWRVPCFCEKKLLLHFTGYNLLLYLTFRILKSQVLSVNLEDGGNKHTHVDEY